MFKFESFSVLPLILFGIVLTMPGCQPAEDEGPISLAAAEFSIRINDPDVQGPRHGEEAMEPQAMRQRLAHRSRFASEVGRILHTSRSWQEAHRGVQRLLEPEPAPEWPMLGRVYREQYVAGRMLYVEPLRLSSSPEALEATAFYTRLLIENDSPEAGLVVEALRKLDGYLSVDEHTALAARAFAAAEVELARLTDCADCPLERLRERRPELFGAAGAYRETRLAVAVEELEQMLDSSPASTATVR